MNIAFFDVLSFLPEFLLALILRRTATARRKRLKRLDEQRTPLEEPRFRKMGLGERSTISI
jgi:hypothetical protein